MFMNISISPLLFSGSSECVRLLIDVGANLEAHDCHFGTPLHVACAREHLDCVKVLLNAGMLLLTELVFTRLDGLPALR